MKMQRRTGFLLWLFAVVVGMALHAPIASAVVTTYRSAVIFGTASTWSGAIFGSTNAPQGIYWNSADGLPHVHQASGTEFPITAAGLAPGGGYQTLAMSGTPVTQRATMNFSGSGVSCVDNSGNARTDCTVKAPGVFNAMDYGAIGNNIADDTTALQAMLTACTTGVGFIPAGAYKISSALTISPQCKIVGGGRGVTTINQTNASAYAFQYLSALSGNRDLDAGGSLEDLNINAKFGLQLNQSGNYGSVFSQEANLKGYVIRRVTMTGTYGSGADANWNTSTAITETAAEAFGVGINIAKMFDMRIQDSLIQAYGVAVRFDGCDLNTIDNNRFNSNARVWYSYFHDTYGSQNLLHHNDVLASNRVGWVYLDGSAWHTIDDNYFEAYTPAATYIQTANDHGTNIIGNRFDNTTQTVTPWIVAAPAYGMNVYGNRWNPNTASPPTTFQSTNWSSAFPVLATWTNNAAMGSSQPFPTPNFPGVVIDRFDPYAFRYNNFNNASGVVSSSWPWITSGVTGRYVLNTASSSFIYNFYQQDRSHRRFEVAVTGRKVTAGGFMLITYVENSVSYTLRSASAGLASTTADQTVKFTVTLPDAVIGVGSFADSHLQMELVTTEAEFESIIITPVDYELASAAPTANTYALGDIIYNNAPSSTSVRGWVCTTAGVAGSTAVFTPFGFPSTTETLANKTLSSPTLSGTVAGAPTWSSAQTLPALTVTHLAGSIGAGSIPTIAAGTGIGGTQTVTVSAGSTDSAGSLTMTGTAGGTASATVATVTFHATPAWGSAPRCQITPANAAASALSGAGSLYLDQASTTTTLFVIKAGATLLPAGTYLYNYDCTQ